MVFWGSERKIDVVLYSSFSFSLCRYKISFSDTWFFSCILVMTTLNFYCICFAILWWCCCNFNFAKQFLLNLNRYSAHSQTNITQKFCILVGVASRKFTSYCNLNTAKISLCIYFLKVPDYLLWNRNYQISYVNYFIFVLSCWLLKSVLVSVCNSVYDDFRYIVTMFLRTCIYCALCVW